ncbi:MAG TPA: hypothetical protein VFD27_06055 [Chthoniobacteraceae bacterium]|nr:hypothetical protein [Chthoniobacteraceae bacterium]
MHDETNDAGRMPVPLVLPIINLDWTALMLPHSFMYAGRMFLLALALIPSGLWADPPPPGPPIDVSGVLPAGTTVWSGIIHVTGNVTVPVGGMLQVEPGTEIRFEGGRQLTIQGALQILGTADCHVRCTGIPGTAPVADPASSGLPPAPPKWAGIQFVDSMSAANVVTWCDIVDAQSLNGSIGLTRSRALIDHCTFAGSHWRLVYANASAPIIQYCTFPDMFAPNENPITLGIDNVAEQIKAEGTIPAAHRFLVYRNTFGSNKGHNDSLDLDSGQWPGRIVEVRENFFSSSGDEFVDLGGDVYIEGNVFRHVSKFPGMTNGVYANAISTGDAGGVPSVVVVVRNVFWDVDHAISCRVNNASIFEHNTVVTIHPDFVDAGGRLNTASALNFRAIAFSDPRGDGASMTGNIFTDLPRVIGNADSPTGYTTLLSYAFNLAAPTASLAIGSRPTTLAQLGPGNVSALPIFVDAAAGDFHLAAGSAGIGSADFGMDMGAFVPAGAWVSRVPSGLSTQRTVALTVGGPGIFACKYRLDGAPWSGAVPFTAVPFPRDGTPVKRTTILTFNNLADGLHVLEVIGQDFAGIWQEEMAPTVRTFAVDATCEVPAMGVRLADKVPPQIPDADVDSDGLTSLEEHSFGLDPNAPDGAPVRTLSADLSGRLLAEFSMPDAACWLGVGPDDVTYRVQSSGDLATWNTIATNTAGSGWTGPATIEMLPSIGGRTPVRVTTPPGADHLFLRVLVEWIP